MLCLVAARSTGGPSAYVGRAPDSADRQLRDRLREVGATGESGDSLSRHAEVVGDLRSGHDFLHGGTLRPAGLSTCQPGGCLLDNSMSTCWGSSRSQIRSSRDELPNLRRLRPTGDALDL
jgi:hypothetical protein